MSINPNVVTVGPLDDHALDKFWEFVSERQTIFTLRKRGWPPPWTDDPVLANYRFCNVYRAADRVSQFLIREVIQEGSQEIDELIFRCILFRIFNLPETYDELCSKLGDVPSLRNWSPALYARIINARQNAGYRTWGSAYIMRPTQVSFGLGRGAKVSGWLDVLHQMQNDGLFESISIIDNLRETVRMLQQYPTVGPFLAMQYATDIGYTHVVTWSENNYIQPGVGALRGARRIFKSRVPATVLPGATVNLIYRLTGTQSEALTVRKLPFIPIGGEKGRLLSLIDIQNCLCEFDKWARLGMRPRDDLDDMPAAIKRKFDPNVSAVKPPIQYVWPTRWGIQES